MDETHQRTLRSTPNFEPLQGLPGRQVIDIYPLVIHVKLDDSIFTCTIELTVIMHHFTTFAIWSYIYFDHCSITDPTFSWLKLCGAPQIDNPDLISQVLLCCCELVWPKFAVCRRKPIVGTVTGCQGDYGNDHHPGHWGFTYSLSFCYYISLLMLEMIKFSIGRTKHLLYAMYDWDAVEPSKFIFDRVIERRNRFSFKWNITLPRMVLLLIMNCFVARKVSVHSLSWREWKCG